MQDSRLIKSMIKNFTKREPIIMTSFIIIRIFFVLEIDYQVSRKKIPQDAPNDLLINFFKSVFSQVIGQNYINMMRYKTKFHDLILKMF